MPRLPLNNYSIAITLNALSKAGLIWAEIDVPLQEGLLVSIANNTESFNSQELAIILNALSKMGLMWADIVPLQKGLLGAIDNNTADFKPQELAIALSALSKMGLTWTDQLPEASQPNIPVIIMEPMQFVLEPQWNSKYKEIIFSESTKAVSAAEQGQSCLRRSNSEPAIYFSSQVISALIQEPVSESDFLTAEEKFAVQPEIPTANTKENTSINLHKLMPSINPAEPKTSANSAKQISQPTKRKKKGNKTVVDIDQIVMTLPPLPPEEETAAIIVATLTKDNIATTKKTAYALMRKIVEFDDEIYFGFKQQHDFQKIVKGYGPKTPEDLELYRKIVSKNIRCEKEGRTKAQLYFEQIRQANIGDELQKQSLYYAANIVDSNGDTALMLALKKQLHANTILDLISHSHHSIYKTNNCNESVFHAWAQHLNHESIELIKALWQQYIAVAKLHLCDIFSCLHARNSNGDTFIHTLIKNNPKPIACLTLNELFTSDIKAEFSSNLLLKNHAGKTALDLLQECDEYYPDTERLLLKRISSNCLSLCLTIEKDVNIFLPENESFFGDQTHGNLQRMIDAQNFTRLINTVCNNTWLRVNVIKTYPNMSSFSQEKIDKLLKIITKFFAYSEMLQDFNGRILSEIINNHIRDTNNVDPEDLRLLDLNGELGLLDLYEESGINIASSASKPKP